MIDISKYTKEELVKLIAKIVSKGYDYVIRGKFLLVYRLYIG